MKSLVTIATGWKNAFFPTPATEKMFNRRLQICDSCPMKRQLSPAGQWILELINDEANTFYCGMCGCPLAALLSSPMAHCNNNRWQPEIISSDI